MGLSNNYIRRMITVIFMMFMIISGHQSIIADSETVPSNTLEKVVLTEWFVSGVIVDKGSGAPVAEAVIDLLIDPLDRYSHPLKTVTTNERGVYRFTLGENDLPASEVVLGVVAEKYAVEIKRLPFTNSVTDTYPLEMQCDFQLLPGRTITGTVMDRKGVVVEGAQVTLISEEEVMGIGNGYPFRKAYPMVVSDDKGKFRLFGGSIDSDCYITAKADGYMPYERLFPPWEDGKVEIVLTQGDATIVGQVVKFNGEPAAHVPVRTEYGGSDQENRYYLPVLDEQYYYPKVVMTYTDATGAYCLDALRPGWQKITAGYCLPYTCIDSQTLFVGEGKVVTVNLKFPMPVTREILFVDKATQKPVPGVRVCNINPNMPPPFELKKSDIFSGVHYIISDKEGKVKFPNNSSSSLYVYYSPPEPYYNPNEVWEDFSTFGGVKDCELSPPITFTGTAFLSDGKTPASGAEIIISRFSHRWSRKGSSYSKGITNSSGKFNIKKSTIIMGHYYAIAQLGELYAEKGLSYAGEDGGLLTDFEIVLKEPGYISGIVRTEEGKTLEGIRVKITGYSEDSGHVNRIEKTNENGRLTFYDLFSADYTMKIDRYRHQVECAERKVSLKTGETREDVDFIIPEFRQLRGNILDRNGDGIEGALLYYFDRYPIGCNTASTKDGYFFMDCLPNTGKSISLSVTHPSFQPTVVHDLIPGDKFVEITLEPRPQLSFIVEDDHGEQVIDFYYELRKQRLNLQRTDHSYSRRVYAQKEPVTEMLSAEGYYIHVWSLDGQGEKGERYGSQFFEAKADETVDLKVTLKSLSTVKGTVKNIDGDFMADVSVGLIHVDSLGYESTYPKASVNTDTQGDFVFTGIESGTYRVTPGLKGYSQEGEYVFIDVKEGVSVPPIELVLTKGVKVSGWITGPDGKPLAGSFDDNLVSIGRNLACKHLRYCLTCADKFQKVTDEYVESCDLTANGRYCFEHVPSGLREVCIRDNIYSDNIKYSEFVLVGKDKDVVLDINLEGFVLLNGQWKTNKTDCIAKVLFSSKGSKEVREAVEKYSIYLKPGEYDVYLASADGRTNCHSGQSLFLSSESTEQWMPFEFNVQDILVTIDSADSPETLSGTMAFVHESESGHQTTSTFPVTEKRFPLNGVPLGRCRGEFTAEDGRRYVSEDWVEITESSEPHLFLLPEEVAEKE